MWLMQATAFPSQRLLLNESLSADFWSSSYREGQKGISDY